MATELIPPIIGESDHPSDWPAAWDHARVARAGLDFVTVTTTYTAELEDHLIIADATAGAFTITLPPVADAVGYCICFKAKSVAGGNITIDGNASETIDGATTLVLNTLYQKARLFCDGVVWWTL